MTQARSRSLVGNIVGWDQGNNTIFDANCSRNRDDCLEPFRCLRDAFQARGIRLDTVDVNQRAGVAADFSLYIESADVITAGANYLFRFESDMLVPRNADPHYLDLFAAVFTWEGRLVDGDRFVRMFLPNPLSLPSRFGFSQRPDFCTMIAANKRPPGSDARELYSKRAMAIRWFERHAPSRFNLYGIGWQKPPKRGGLWGSLVYRKDRLWYSLVKTPATPSYRGPVQAKREVLERNRFCLCFENARIDDYLTEKIFDSFFAGCVPVYWGAPNVGEMIPADCFVDMRQFADMAELYRYLEAMTEDQYLAHQHAIQQFLSGPGFTPFSSQNFAATVVNKVVSDFAAAGRISQ